MTVDLGKVVTKPVAFTIVDQQGRLLKQGQLLQQVQKINVANLRAGLYNLKMSDGQVIKLLKQ